VEDVAVCFMQPDATWKEGASAGAFTALALVQWLWRPMTTHGVVSVTGPINLRGYLLPADGIEEKAGHAQKGNASMLIMSTDTYSQVGGGRGLGA
jgi:ATP-dependent Lon protease